MQTFHRSPFLTIHTEGALLPVDLLQRVLAGDKDLGGLTPADYHLPGREKLNEAVNRSWNRLQGAWAAFQTSKSRLKEGDPGTTLTRERWLLPLFQELGYGRLVTAKAIEIEGKAYPISHSWANVPIHLVGCGVDLDRRAAGVAGASRSSPHSLMQELLNRADDRQWGIAANGLRLRILRDNASLTRQAYLEFDLEAMFSGDVYADFVLLWLLGHQSRFESADGKTEDPWLEKWTKAAQESGTRALGQLYNGVKEAIIALGNGFLSHTNNQGLRKKLHSGELDAQDYYRELLRLVYRLIFLFAAEDRDLLLDPGAEPTARNRYLRYYSTARLRRLAERQRGGRHADIWIGLQVVMDILGGVGEEPQSHKEHNEFKENQENFVNFVPSWFNGLGLPVLGGFLFSHKALPDLEASQVDNQALLTATRSLAFTVEGGSLRTSSLRAVDYKNLGPEELGSVYESLLELHPRINSEAGTFELSSASGHERKTTGSYYTPTSLIQVLLDSALDPVIEQAIEEASKEWNRQDAKSTKGDLGEKKDFASLASSRLLNLKVCDPACGSGHFLIAAAHRIARRLAQIQAGGDEPPPSALRQALRAVIARCIYGVDVNPMAVELCKVNLWLESIEPGKPLSFLDAHIQCGDSLVGVGPGLDISEIPDEAFNPAFGDDKATASALKKRNKRERGGQLGFRWKVTELTSAEDLARWRAERFGQVDAMPEDDPSQVKAKAQAYTEYQETQEYIRNRLEYDLWTAAFFWRISKGNAEQMIAPTQQELIMLRSGRELDARLVEKVHQMAGIINFFHWELVFPQVFTGNHPGFDCMLGNPPWERIKLQEEEFFAARDPEIASAPNKAARQKLIGELQHTNPALANAFEQAKHLADATAKFIRQSSRFPLTAVGDTNTYTLFVELARDHLSGNGYSGIIVHTGVATDHNTRFFFSDLTFRKSLVSLYDFENREKLFPSVDSRYKFCLFTISNSEIAQGEFLFFATRVEHLSNENRRFTLSANEIYLFNPNTKNLPIFRTKQDAELTRKIYKQVPVFIREYYADNGKVIERESEWGCDVTRTFDMDKFGDIALSQRQLVERAGKLLPNGRYLIGGEEWVQIIESKTFWHFDHRLASYEGTSHDEALKGNCIPLTDFQKVEFDKIVLGRYWLPMKIVDKYTEWHDKPYWIAYRNITNTTNERTMVATLIPRHATDYTVRLVYGGNAHGMFAA